eukprot:365271-Chlamydomonas_euryale.AAC.12
MPDESAVKQLLFAEGLVGPGSTWRDMTALRLVLTSLLVGRGWCGVAQDRTQWRAVCESALPVA